MPEVTNQSSCAQLLEQCYYNQHLLTKWLMAAIYAFICSVD